MVGAISGSSLLIYSIHAISESLYIYFVCYQFIFWLKFVSARCYARMQLLFCVCEFVTLLVFFVYFPFWPPFAVLHYCSFYMSSVLSFKMSLCYGFCPSAIPFSLCKQNIESFYFFPIDNSFRSFSSIVSCFPSLFCFIYSDIRIADPVHSGVFVGAR